MSILKDFFDGKLYPHEEINTYDPALKQINEKIETEREVWLKNVLTGEEFKRFEDLQECYDEAYDYWEEKGFMYGFKLGMLMMHEIMEGKKDMLKDTY